MRFELGGVTLDAVGPAELVVTDFDPGDHQLRTDDIEITGRPGAIPTRDVEQTSTWQLSILATDGPTGTALDHVAALAAAWRPSELLQPGRLVPMRYELAGRWRRVYGRPGQFADTDGRFLDQGEAEVLAAFRVLDPRFYGDEEETLTLGIVPATSAGLIFPATPPFTWRSSGDAQSRVAEVAGDMPTPPRITFRGPVARPWVRIGDERVALTATLAYDESVTIDARTRTVTRADGASAAALLDPRSRLADLVLMPGHHDVTFGGMDVTGTASATIAWRSAWRSL